VSSDERLFVTALAYPFESGGLLIFSVLYGRCEALV